MSRQQVAPVIGHHVGSIADATALVSDAAAEEQHRKGDAAGLSQRQPFGDSLHRATDYR